MLKRFSNWLDGYEGLFRLCYRLLLLTALAYGLLRIEFIGDDLASIADELESLSAAIAEMQGSADEETALGARYPAPASAHHPVHRGTL